VGLNEPTLTLPASKLPDFDSIARIYEERQAKPGWRPAGTKARPWRAEQAQTRAGSAYKPVLDAETLHEAPAPPWTIAQVKEAEPEFVSDIRDRLWEMYQSASEAERNTIFMQGIKQNPEYAAATIVRRMLMNSQTRDTWMTGTVVPRLGEAAQNTLQMSNTWRWLNYVLGNQRKPVPAPQVPPPPGEAGAGNRR
jgi:hypothetical protein